MHVYGRAHSVLFAQVAPQANANSAAKKRATTAAKRIKCGSPVGASARVKRKQVLRANSGNSELKLRGVTFSHLHPRRSRLRVVEERGAGARGDGVQVRGG